MKYRLVQIHTIFGEEKRYMKKNNVLLVIFSIVILCSDAFAWNAEFTHRDLSQYAAEHSMLNEGYLGNIGFAKGLADEKLVCGGKKLSITDWFREGAEFEDEGSAFSGRFYNHFHNPLYSHNQWGDAGLTSAWPWINSGNSAVLWAVNDSSNDWRWARVRDYYYNALTASTDADRQANFAQTFRGIGQLIHLIQDMAQPAHVRNDPHPADDRGADPGFEYWAKRRDIDLVDLMSHPVYPADSLNTTVSGYSPITRFFDTDQYDGTNPSISLSLGLAEYTNANFVSEDTIFKDFAYPRREDTVVFAESQNKTSNGFEVYRKYFEKVGGGQAIKHFTTASRLYAYRLENPSPALYGFDDRCYKDYADLLIPRAVGYSAALINYFFRGKLDVIPASGGLQVRNSGDEEMTYYTDPSGHETGQISIYYDDADKIRHPLTTYDLTTFLAPGETTPVIPFSPPSDPPNIEPGRYIVVFHGKLGEEEGAIIGKVTSPQRLYYVSVRSGIYKIYSMKTDGSEPTVVYDNPDSALKIGKLALSPDGKTLALTVNGPQIYLLNIAAGNLTLLTNGGWPAWSPDGKKIAFSREMGRYSPFADEHIFTINVETRAATQLTDSTASAYNSTPAWSPDGGRIAYMKFGPDGDTCKNTGAYAIYLMDSAGHPISPLTCVDMDYKDETPAWSPDGSEIAFSRGRGGKYSQLHKVNVETREITKLTDSTGENYAELTPSWFPERGKIAVGSKIDGDFDIWLVDSAGGGYIENLTDSNPDIDGYPVF
jgi:WD40 repeat protein